MACTQSSSGAAELGRFLRARRARTSPDQVGLTVGTGLRRTPGLRREEVATLAGMSVDYYVRLERGREAKPSPAVLDGLARALRLDDQEHQHVRELAARAARYTPETPPPPNRSVRPHLELLLDTLRPSPAYIVSRNLDLIAWNPGALALYAGLDDRPVEQRNLARYLFLHPTSRELYSDWEYQAGTCLALLRAQAGTAPDAPDLTGLVDELLLKSPDFTKMWDRYDVTGRHQVRKTYHHPEIGTFTLSGQAMPLENTSGQWLGVHVAEPGTPDHDAMVLLDRTAPEPVTRSAMDEETQPRPQA